MSKLFCIQVYRREWRIGESKGNWPARDAKNNEMAPARLFLTGTPVCPVGYTLLPLIVIVL